MQSYIALGLTALARTAQVTGNSGFGSWFAGHYGAAVIAGGFLLENEEMDEKARALITKQLDKIIAKYEKFFVPLEKEATVSLTSLLKAVEQNCSQLSTSGHGVIYGTLALRALRVFPDMATAFLLRGLVQLLETTQDDNWARYLGVDDYREYEAEWVESDLVSTVQRAFRMSCENLHDNQEVDGKRLFFVGEKIHGITHAQALHSLSMLGYPELAEKGLLSLNKQIELNEKYPPGPASTERLSLNLRDDSFWSREFEDPHSIKLAYSAVELNCAFGNEAIPLEKLSQQFAFLH